ncbi:hypothetical protein MKX01_038954 [Papaver californicum]|nr:hypothetical protein MKX01_038954 [Papaver californicum]
MAMTFLKKTSNFFLNNKHLLHHHHPIGSPVAARRIEIPSSTSSSLSDSLSRLRRDSSRNQVLSDVLGQSSSPFRGPRMDNNLQFTDPPRGRTGFTGLRRFDVNVAPHGQI